MKLLVIGSCVLDTVVDESISSTRPGGIFYTISGLNSLKSTDDEVVLATEIDHESYSYFEDAFSGIELVNEKSDVPIPKVRLELLPDTERKEIYSNFSGNINLKKIKNLKSYNGILLNMITGADINISELKNLREKTDSIFYCDVHTLSRSINENGSRVFRRIPDFDEWLKCIDILQANENEALTLTDSENEVEIAEKVLSKSVKIFVITKGSKGITCYSSDGAVIKKTDLPARKVESVNFVGCGDIFGSVFFYSYISGLELEKCLKRAVSLSAIVTTFSEINDFKKLRDYTNGKYFER